MTEFQQYALHGWFLCPIDRGYKGPRLDDWNNPEKIREVTAAAEGLDGAGICHVESQTCAIDIDNMTQAKAWLAERDVDLDSLLTAPDAVRIESGKPGRSKLLYKMKRPLRTVQPRGVGIELRCATIDGLSMQDCLPPTLHPETRKPYKWVYGEPLLGDWRKLPPAPAGILNVWRKQIAEVGDRAIAQTNSSSQTLIALGRLEKLIFKNRDPNCEYPDWIEVGMQLHHEGNGSQEAFDIWKRWSMGATRRFSDSGAKGSYPGDDVLITHWRSFESREGKAVVTGASLIAEDVAEPDEFPEENTNSNVDARPVIALVAGELHKYAARCERILSDDVYVRERQLVRIGRADELAPARDEAVRRDEAQAAIIPVTPEYIRRRLTQRVRFGSHRGRQKEFVPVDCPKGLALNIAGQGEWPAMRRLTTIATAPFIRPDGSICETRGYDAACSVFYQPNADFSAVPASPTRKDAERALAILLEPFSEFPFANDAARSAFAAHILTEIVRPAINTSPAFFYTAPTPGTGKTLLSEMPSRIAHGHAPALRPWAEGSEELRKNLFSSLLAGDRTIGFDNLPNGLKVRSPTLCGFLTADKYGDRKLGVSEVLSIPNRSVISLTGNNLTPTGDLARRSLVIRLDADTATLRDRRFRIPDLRGYLRKDRPALLIAALTVVRAYNASGEAIGKPPLPSFEPWSGFVRDPLLWLGMADPAATQDDETDDETAPLAEAFESIAAILDENEFTARDLAEACVMLLDGNPLPAAIEAAGCKAATEPKQLGFWLRGIRDRIAGGFKLTQGAQARGAGMKWKLRKLGP